jgi:hypothetical protein
MMNVPRPLFAAASAEHRRREYLPVAWRHPPSHGCSSRRCWRLPRIDDCRRRCRSHDRRALVLAFVGAPLTDSRAGSSWCFHLIAGNMAFAVRSR